MDIIDALVIVRAYEHQGSLTGPRRRLLAMARTAIWERAEQIAHQVSEAPRSGVPQTDVREFVRTLGEPSELTSINPAPDASPPREPTGRNYEIRR